MSESHEWLRSFDEYEDNEKAALAALEDLGRLSQRTRTLLLPILTEAFLMIRRSVTRNVERSISLGEVYGGASTLDERRTRLEQTFPLPDGRRVSWLDATEADHLARIAYLEKHIVGIERTIASHHEAVQLIQSHGVSCLGEIEDAA